MSFDWYELVTNSFTQGDIFLGFPVPVAKPKEDHPYFLMGWTRKNVIVVTQACDIEQGKVDTISFCEIVSINEITKEIIENEKRVSFIDQQKNKLLSLKKLTPELGSLGVDLQALLKEIKDIDLLKKTIEDLKKQVNEEENIKILDDFLTQFIESSDIRMDFTNEGDLKKARKYIDKIRKGEFTNMHLLNQCKIGGELKMAGQVVLLKDTYQVLVESVEKIINNCYQDGHLRLLPPYREHLAQAYSNTFNRIGLPQDIEIDKLQF